MAEANGQPTAEITKICLCCTNHSATLLAACNCMFVSIMSITLMIVYRFLYNVPWHSFEVMSTLLLTLATFSLFMCLCFGAVLRNQVLLSVWVAGFSLVALYIGFTMVSTFINFRFKRRGIVPPLVIAELCVLLIMVLTSVWCIAAVIARIFEMSRGLYYYEDEFLPELSLSPPASNKINGETVAEKDENENDQEANALAYDQYELVRSAFHCEPGQVPRCEQTRQIWTRQATALYDHNTSEAPLLPVNFPTFRHHHQQQQAIKSSSQNAKNNNGTTMVTKSLPASMATNSTIMSPAATSIPLQNSYGAQHANSYGETAVKYVPVSSTNPVRSPARATTSSPFRSNNNDTQRQYKAPLSYSSPSTTTRNVKIQRTQFFNPAPVNEFSNTANYYRR